MLQYVARADVCVLHDAAVFSHPPQRAHPGPSQGESILKVWHLRRRCGAPSRHSFALLVRVVSAAHIPLTRRLRAVSRTGALVLSMCPPPATRALLRPSLNRDTRAHRMNTPATLISPSHRPPCSPDSPPSAATSPSPILPSSLAAHSQAWPPLRSSCTASQHRAV
jgi:hypothetical protein